MGRAVKILHFRICIYPITLLPYLRKDTSVETRSFLILPDNLNVTGSIEAEQRKRSIYSVLLYNSTLNAKGNFNIQIPGRY